MATHPAVERLGAELFPTSGRRLRRLRRVEALVGAPSKLPGGSLMPPGSRSVKPNPGSESGPRLRRLDAPVGVAAQRLRPGVQSLGDPRRVAAGTFPAAPSRRRPTCRRRRCPRRPRTPPAPAKAAPLEAGPEPALRCGPAAWRDGRMAEDPALGTARSHLRKTWRCRSVPEPIRKRRALSVPPPVTDERRAPAPPGQRGAADPPRPTGSSRPPARCAGQSSRPSSPRRCSRRSTSRWTTRREPRLRARLGPRAALQGRLGAGLDRGRGGVHAGRSAVERRPTNTRLDKGR
jgi:hypothetical protein